MFYCVNDHVPVETVALLRGSCAERGIEFVDVDARSFDFARTSPLSPGSILYRPAVSIAAIRVEQFLHAEGVATFYAQPDGVFFPYVAQPLLYQRAGVPIARTVPCFTASRSLLRSYVEALGGFPLVMKMPGNSGGVGVLRVDSLPALYSLADYVLARGDTPVLCTFIAESTHWRVIVVGATAVAAYRNTRADGDFRTYGGHRREDFFEVVDDHLARLAVRAVSVLRLEHGGVDILEDPHGQLYVLETNFPCYYPHAQQVAGIDISGKMVDFLAAKAKRLRNDV